MGGPAFDPEQRYTVAGEALGRLLGPGAGDHHPANCSPGPCPIHYPSRHALTGMDLRVGEDTRLFVRVCDHGRLHPDPDDPRWSWTDDGHIAHDCDGCCASEPA